MAILVTGGAGYIGSHTCVELLQAGYDVVVLDNLSNASEKSLERVKAITGKEVTFYKGDILDRDILNQIMDKEQIDSCIHFAGLKAVGESVEKPWEYYNNNIAGTLTLVDVMRQHGVKNIIFSSSATVYGNPAQIPITEECPKGQCTNPYGWTKSMLEQILTDMQKADPEWNVILLRYFNPIGAHPSGTMGENPNGIPNNLSKLRIEVFTEQILDVLDIGVRIVFFTAPVVLIEETEVCRRTQIFVFNANVINLGITVRGIVFAVIVISHLLAQRGQIAACVAGFIVASGNAAVRISIRQVAFWALACAVLRPLTVRQKYEVLDLFLFRRPKPCEVD